MKNLRTIVLAAGKGTRMKSGTPKVLHPVCGKPMLEHVLDTVRSAGSLRTYVVLGHQHPRVRKALELGRDRQVVVQKKLLGTADAVKSVSGLKTYGGDVLVLCGDTPLLTKNTLRRLLRRHRKSRAHCTVLTAVMDDPGSYGRIIREDGRIAAIREQRDATAGERHIREINTGVYCFKARALFSELRKVKRNRRKKEFYLTDVVALFARSGRKVESVTTADPEEALGINDRTDLAFAEWLLRQRILEKWMLRGVTVMDPQTTYVDTDVSIGRDTVLYPCTVIERDVKIGRDCRVGPFARIRSGSRIGRRVEIGSFGEISRTRLGDGSLVKHFGFLGDAVVGREANIGAGVVTANFDGRTKSPTRIGAKAFIGSDSVLIAPARIGPAAVTGAGCVIKKGSVIPAGSVVAGVPARIVRRKTQ